MTSWRALLLAGITVALVFGSIESARQQVTDPNAAPTTPDTWPPYNIGQPEQFAKPTGEIHGRGHGFYFSLIKLGLFLPLFFLWVKTTDWAAQDCIRTNQSYAIWNPVLIGPFVFAFLLFLLLPWYEIGMLILAAAWLFPLGIYVIVRNKPLEAHQKVMTPSHLRHVFSDVMGKLGVKVATERKLDYQKGPPVNFKATSGGGRDGEANLMMARRSPAYVPAKEVVADLLDRHGDAVMLETAAPGVAVRFQIDGVWHNVDTQDADPGALIMAVLKTLGGLDPNERVKRQEGIFPTDYKGTHYLSRVQSQGIEGGERTIVYYSATKQPVKTFEELGMRAKAQEQLKELLARQQALIIFSALPGGGLSSLFDAALKSCDRYMRDFASVEDVTRREHDIENVHVTTFNPAAGEKPLAVLDKIVRTYPNAVVLRGVADGETAKFLCDQVKEDRLVMTSIRAKDAPETLLRMLMLKVPPKDFINTVSGVVCVRLVRKLCDDCKEPYPAPAEALAAFGIPPGKVQTLFQPPTQADPKKPCATCEGIGYKGRTGLYELLVVDDGLREVLIKSPKMDLVRAAARRGGMKTFQEEGLVLVVKGVTSLAELQRVLKG